MALCFILLLGGFAVLSAANSADQSQLSSTPDGLNGHAHSAKIIQRGAKAAAPPSSSAHHIRSAAVLGNAAIEISVQGEVAEVAEVPSSISSMIRGAEFDVNSQGDATRRKVSAEIQNAKDKYVESIRFAYGDELMFLFQKWWNKDEAFRVKWATKTRDPSTRFPSEAVHSKYMKRGRAAREALLEVAASITEEGIQALTEEGKVKARNDWDKFKSRGGPSPVRGHTLHSTAM